MNKVMITLLLVAIISLSLFNFAGRISVEKVNPITTEGFEAEEINGYNLKDVIPFGK